MQQSFMARHLDVRKFAAAGGRLAGEEDVRNLERLRAETQALATHLPLRWSARGEVRDRPGSVPQPWLHLDAAVILPLLCQRCLQPVEVPVSVDAWFRFVPDEATASAEDEASDEDVLVATRKFDLVALVEDEILMEMPVVPAHETCPSELPRSSSTEDFNASETERVRPFAVLARKPRS